MTVTDAGVWIRAIVDEEPLPPPGSVGVLMSFQAKATQGPRLTKTKVTDILTKAYGSTSPKNLVKATIAALRQLRNVEQVEEIRGVKLAVASKN